MCFMYFPPNWRIHHFVAFTSKVRNSILFEVRAVQKNIIFGNRRPKFNNGADEIKTSKNISKKNFSQNVDQFFSISRTISSSFLLNLGLLLRTWNLKPEISTLDGKIYFWMQSVFTDHGFLKTTSQTGSHQSGSNTVFFCCRSYLGSQSGTIKHRSHWCCSHKPNWNCIYVIRPCISIHGYANCVQRRLTEHIWVWWLQSANNRETSGQAFLCCQNSGHKSHRIPLDGWPQNNYIWGYWHEVNINFAFLIRSCENFFYFFWKIGFKKLRGNKIKIYFFEQGAYLMKLWKMTYFLRVEMKPIGVLTIKDSPLYLLTF